MWDKMFRPIFCCILSLTAAHNIGGLFLFREEHPKFRNAIQENFLSLRSPTRNFRNFWSNGKRPLLPHRLDVKSITWTMPFEPQNSNTLGMSSHCPFKGLKSVDLIIIKFQLQVIKPLELLYSSDNHV